MEVSSSWVQAAPERVDTADLSLSLALIERGHAWDCTLEAFEAARAGRGSVVLLDGPPGVGKSELMRAIRAYATESGITALVACGRHDEQGFGYGVALQLLESRLTAGDDPLQPTFDVLHGLYRVCAGLASSGPLLILVDDADLADEESLRFLVHLVRRIDELPIAVVMTAGAAAHRRELSEVVWGSPTSARWSLAPLSQRGTARRVATRWPEATEEACREIHDLSGGYPLIADALAAAGATPASDPLPAIAGWVLRRARHAHDDAPALLVAIAVLGPECRLHHAAKLAGLDLEAAPGVVDLLVESGILKAEEPMSFKQPIVATAIEASQAPGEQAAACLRAARLLAQEGAPSEAVARHLLSASSAGREWVVDVLSDAAAVALRRAAPARAVGYLRRALDEPPAVERRGQVVLELGRAEALAGEPQAADRLSEGAAEVAANADQEPSAALATGRTLFALGETGQAMAVFERAMQETDGDHEMERRLHADHAAASWLTRLSEGRAGGELPAADIDAPGDRGLLALHAMDGAMRGTDCREVSKLAMHALAEGELLKTETAEGMTYYLAATALAIAEDLQRAEAALTAAVEDARSRGSVLGLANASAVRAMTKLLGGRVVDAATDARNSVAAERHGWRFGLGDARVVLAHSLIETGDLAGAERELALADAAVPDSHPSRISLLAARGRLQLLSGNAARALDDFSASGRLADKAGARNPAVSPWRSGAGVAMAALGDSAEAERLIAAELSLAESFGAPGPIGRALRAMASIQAPAAALETLEAAVQTLEGAQAALERSRALVDFGAALRRSGRRVEARPPLREGLEIARRCGAEVLAVRATREVTAAGGRLRRAALTGPGSLTERERQVASLAAEGLSNREIAETLVVTVKTIEWHLKHSYRKLGIGSRHQLGDFFPAEAAGAASRPPR